VDPSESNSNGSGMREEDSDQRDLSGCGPGGRGFESPRSPSSSSLQIAGLDRRSEPPFTAAGTHSGTDARASTAGTRDIDAGDEPPLRLRGYELDLYAKFHFKLLGIVTSEVHASREDIEDGCAFAWAQFLRVQPDRDGPWKSWLVTTARRDVWKLNARHQGVRAIVGEDELELGTTLEPADPRDRIETALEFQAAMEELRELPERAARLRELEDDPPDRLVKTIGTIPARSKSSSEAILAWRRAALAIDDCRRVEAESCDVPGPALERQRELVQRAITSLGNEKRRRHRGPELGLER
jgi:hypothetical protein